MARRPRKIVICIDGTNNEIGERPTNVLRLYMGLRKDETQAAHYILGVGSSNSTQLLGKTRQQFWSILGMGFGLGLEDDVLNAYRYLCHTYEDAGKPDRRPEHERDRIYIAGFSRGAYGARILAGFIHNFGLVTPDQLHLIAPVFRAYRRITDAEGGETPDVVFRAMREYDAALRPQPVPIRALLLWDTVNSMIRLRRPLRNLALHGSLLEFGTHANVNANGSVRIVLHALAIDEKRSLFRPQLWAEHAATPPAYWGNRFKRKGSRRTQFVRQRWFAGYHSDIGGSPPENEAGIGKLTLLWMLDTLEDLEAEADAEDRAAVPGSTGWSGRQHGLTLYRGHRRNYWEGGSDKTTPGGLRFSQADPEAPIHDSHHPGPLGTFAWHLLEIVPKSIARRAKGPPRWFRRGLLWWYLPLKEPRTIPDSGGTPAFHAIDPSVWARVDALPGYRPKNLAGRGPRAET